jgi:PKD repeat protein
MKLSISFVVLFTLVFASCQPDNNRTNDPVPDANFTDSALVRSLPASVTFTNTSSFTTPGASYLWDFGDGATSTQTSPVHMYPSAGVYQVRLVQTTSAGQKDTVTRLLMINPAAAAQGSGQGGTSTGNTANFTFAAPVYASYTVYFKNTSTNATGYTWYFGNGATSTSPAATVNHSYTSPGSYNVKLVATGPGGIDSTTKVVTVQ